MQFVYGLADPITGAIRYIGMTNDPHVRHKAHCRENDDTDTKSRWIRELKKAKLLPSLLIVEQVESDDAIRERERYWIQFYLNQGANLTNTQVPSEPVGGRKPISQKTAKVPSGKCRQPSKELMSEALMNAFNRKINRDGGYSLRQLAKTAGIGYAHLHRIMHGKCLPSWDKLLMICKALECSCDDELDKIFESALYRTPTAKEFEEGHRAA